MKKDNVLRTALLKLGETSIYNQNQSEEYKAAELMFENVINTVSVDARFKFNQNITTLKKSRVDTDGKHWYYLPYDFLGLIAVVQGRNVRFQDELAYMDDEGVIEIIYLRKIPFEDIPDYMFDYFVYSLALEIAETYDLYKEKIQLLDTRKQQAEQLVKRIGFTNITRKRD